MDEPLRRPRPAPFRSVPIDRADVFTSVLRRLETWLAQGDLKVGDRLPPERELAEQLGVSRGSLRQALKVLTNMNRIEQRHGSGNYVTGLVSDPVAAAIMADLDSVVPGFLPQLAETRAAIDCAALRSATTRMTDGDLDDLEDFLRGREAELADEPAAPGSLDTRFEAKLARIGENAVLMRLQAAIHDLHIHTWAEFGRAPADVRQLHVEHLEILRALKDRDPDKACDLMYRHVARTEEA